MQRNECKEEIQEVCLLVGWFSLLDFKNTKLRSFSTVETDAEERRKKGLS